MKWDTPRRIVSKEHQGKEPWVDLGAIVPPDTWLPMHYIEAYNILFRIENALRVFVYLVLKIHFAEEWHKVSVVGDGQEKDSISSRTKRLVAQNEKYAYLGHERACHLLLLSLGELVEIMTADTCWRFFARFFHSNRQATLVKFYEIIMIRNALAHFRAINEGDLVTLRKNSEHLLSPVADFLNGTINIVEPVPRCDATTWLKDLQELKSPVCVTSWRQSPGADWSAFVIEWTFPVVGSPNEAWDHGYSVIRLDTPTVLREAPLLRALVSFSYESFDWPLEFDAEKMPVFKKEAFFVFHREVLQQNASDVQGGLKTVLDAVTEDTNLLATAPESTARMVRIAHITSKPKGANGGEHQGLCCDQLDPSLAEYWGVFVPLPGISEFITDTYRFPWFREWVTNAEWLP